MKKIFRLLKKLKNDNFYADIFFSLLFSYVLLFSLSFVISAYFFDKTFGVSLTKDLSKLDCLERYTAKSANPLNIIDFYMNLEYWIASYRLKTSALEKQMCMQSILSHIAEHKKKISVIFVNEKGDVVLKITN